eukprot:COSAG01_NODE_12167_length_1787_cov_56.176034_3_plen_49_part_01
MQFSHVLCVFALNVHVKSAAVTLSWLPEILLVLGSSSGGGGVTDVLGYI